MIDSKLLLKDLKKLTNALVDDLRARTDDVDEVRVIVRDQYRDARDAGRTDRSLEEWREDLLAQVAAAWVLGTVFVRFCEDNGLVATPLLSGPGERRGLAGDHRADWLAEHPVAGDREWLEEIFQRYRAIPATSELFGDHNPLWQFGPTADGGKWILDLWQAIDHETGKLVHDFTDADLDTRFLGDLYQDLSDHAKKTYALLQTPEFVEEFILERTLDPAIKTFGLDEVRMIDPTCGSGHFLLGAFARILEQWRSREPGTPIRELVQRTLDAINGVDLNPFAAAIARFRLLAAALKASSISELADAPQFRLNVAVSDSLLHGTRKGALFTGAEAYGPLLRHRYPTEDEKTANELLDAGRYHVVVGNPPYITVKDAATREAYRALYATAHGKFSLSVPFTERFVDLAVTVHDERAAGYVGLITTNTFMTRSFGRKLIEEYLRKLDITHIIDTSGAHLPGHETTVILFARHQSPVSQAVRTVLGIRSEPGTPEEPSSGAVWSSIINLVDQPGSENDFVSVEDAPRDRFFVHPWSLQGGAAPVVAEVVNGHAQKRLGEIVDAIGITAVTGEDDLYTANDCASFLRFGIQSQHGLVIGEQVRDWIASGPLAALWTYNDDLSVRHFASHEKPARQRLWQAKTLLSKRKRFGIPMLERGATWWEWQELYDAKLRTPLTITFAFVATHNHFVLDRGGKVFNRTAPVIKLAVAATEDEYLKVIGLLNSSTACFWMKQMCYSKGDKGWSDRYEFDGTKLRQFPVPSSFPLDRARKIDQTAQRLSHCLPAAMLTHDSPSRELVHASRADAAALRAQMVALQEELDWECYALYGLTEKEFTFSSDCTPPLERGLRAFEIVLARRMAAGKVESDWFERHGLTPFVEVPAEWPADYRRLVEERIALIETDRAIGLLERPEYKRRWNWDDWEVLEKAALRDWLLDRLEGTELWEEPKLTTAARLTDRLRRDDSFIEAARLYAGRVDTDLVAIVTDLVADEAVPFAAGYRYTASGLRKRREWERVWDQQRAEDAIDALAALPPDHPDHLSTAAAQAQKREQGLDRIPVPPKYGTKDFQRNTYRRLRGKLDVPKERFILYPNTRLGSDSTQVIGWAGWDHLAQARALAAHYTARKDEGAEAPELVGLLAGLQELVPWLVQWHNDLDAAFGQRMGDFFSAFTESEARIHGKTVDDLATWTPG